MLYPFPPQQVNLLYCLFAVSRWAERAASGWHIGLSFSIHWQIYQGNVHLWWACFYIWEWKGEFSWEPKQKRDRAGERGHEDRLIYGIALTHKYTVCSQSPSQQLALPHVQQGCSDTAARRMWRRVYTKNFPEPGPVSSALIHYIYIRAFPRKHTVTHLFAISQHNKMLLVLQVKAGLLSAGPSLYDINTPKAQQHNPLVRHRESCGGEWHIIVSLYSLLSLTFCNDDTKKQQGALSHQ